MKVADVTAFVVSPGWVFVRVRCEDGALGWGECGITSRAKTIRSAVDELGVLLIGRDPRCIEANWQLLKRSSFYTGGPILAAASAGIDIALWDLTARSHGISIHELLGGAVRTRVPAYAWIGSEDDDDHGNLADEAFGKIAAGYWAVKMSARVAEALPTQAEIARVVSGAEAIRTKLGPEGRFAIDLHGRFTGPAGRLLLRALEPSAPLFVEEPTRPEFPRQISELTRSTIIPIAAGERQFERREFLPLFEAGIAIAQPDVAEAFGISETRRIASVAEMYGISVAPHCAIGPIALAASLQVASAIPNLLTLEQDADVFSDGFSRYLVTTALFQPHEGYLEVPLGPGLGIEVNEEAVETDAATGPVPWAPPIWHHPDGSYADW